MFGRHHKFIFIFLLLWGGVWAYAQFEDHEDEPVRKSASQNEDDDSDESDAKSDAKAVKEVTSEDLDKLNEALKSGLEPPLVEAASHILGKNPRHLQALNALALHYYKKNYLGLAKIILLRALTSHANEPALHNNLGIVYLAEGDQRGAIASFRKSLEVKPGYIVGATNLASIYLEYRDYNRALEPLGNGYNKLKSGLREGREEAIGVANNYAVALSAQGQGRQARDIYDEIGRGPSRNMTVLLNYAILLTEKLKDRDDALKVISKIKFVSDDPKAVRRAEELEREIKNTTE